MTGWGLSIITVAGGNFGSPSTTTCVGQGPQGSQELVGSSTTTCVVRGGSSLTTTVLEQCTGFTGSGFLRQLSCELESKPWGEAVLLAPEDNLQRQSLSSEQASQAQGTPQPPSNDLEATVAVGVAIQPAE